MKNIFLSLLSTLTVAPAFINAIRPPGADTPAFYFVASSQSSPANLQPLHTDGTVGGTAAIGIFYFHQGILVAVTSPSDTNRLPPFVNSVPSGGGCTTYGKLLFGSSASNKCARHSTFAIQSNTENSQLGAKLVFNSVGGFYACGGGQEVWYKVSPGDGPTDLTCTPIDLYTVPVV